MGSQSEDLTRVRALTDQSKEASSELEIDDIAVLRNYLRHSDAAVRQHAITALAYGGSDVVGRLGESDWRRIKELLKDSDALVRSRAAFAVGTFIRNGKSLRVESTLVDMLDDQSVFNDQVIVHALSAVKTYEEDNGLSTDNRQELVPELLEVLEHGPADVVSDALDLLNAIGSVHPHHIGEVDGVFEILRPSKYEEKQIQAGIIRIISWLVEDYHSSLIYPSVELMEALLTSDDLSHRRPAARFLAQVVEHTTPGTFIRRLTPTLCEVAETHDDRSGIYAGNAIMRLVRTEKQVSDDLPPVYSEFTEWIKSRLEVWAAGESDWLSSGVIILAIGELLGHRMSFETVPDDVIYAFLDLLESSSSDKRSDIIEALLELTVRPVWEFQNPTDQQESVVSMVDDPAHTADRLDDWRSKTHLDTDLVDQGSQRLAVYFRILEQEQGDIESITERVKTELDPV